MAEVHFTSHLRSLVPGAPFNVTGATVGDALKSLFASEPQVRGYVLDERGALRKHVCIFADGERLAHDAALSRPIGPNARLYVMQALSGRLKRPLRRSADEGIMNDRLLVGTRKGLFTIERGGGGWKTNLIGFPGIPVTNALSVGGAIYAAIKHGHFGPKLHRSNDEGANWREIAVPAFPADAAGAPALFQIWTLEGGGSGHPDQLWIGAIPAGLFRSDDRGETWQLMSSLWNVPERARWFGGGYDAAGIYSISPDPRNCDRVTIAISCGGVWETLDNGAHWSVLGKGLFAPYVPPEQAEDSAIQDPHRVARCTANPDVMWMQHHAGMYRSADAGAHWTRLTPPGDDFGFAVVAHPRDGATAWFVPAIKDEIRMPRDGALCVTKTSDGGKSWDVMRKGLPQHDAYDLVYRHGLDVDGSGNRLAMGSTTGALWISENGGGSWSLNNAHLPPIYSVRFI